MTDCCTACAGWGPLYPSGACRCMCHAPAVTAEHLAAVREAARPPAPTVVHRAGEVREALLWPALAPFLRETPEQAHRREIGERMMQEYVQGILQLTPHTGVGNVVFAEGETPNRTGTMSGPPRRPDLDN